MTEAIHEAPAARDRVTCGGLRWEVVADLRDVFLGPDGLHLPEWLAAGQARIVKHGPHRTVYRVVLPEVDCHVKHCRLQDARAWLRECVRPAKARAEYERCLAVARRGVSTVVPLAVGETCGSGPGDSLLITQTLDAEPLGTFLEQSLSAFDPERGTRLRQRLAVALARFLAKMHAAGIVHHDLHANNLLLSLGPDDEPHLYLIDLHDVRLGAALGWAVRRDNLVVLNRWFTMRASRTDRMRFWRAYSAAAYSEGGQGFRPVLDDCFASPLPVGQPEAPAREKNSLAGASGCQARPLAGNLRIGHLARDLEERTWQSNLRFWAGRDRRCLVNNRYYRRVRSAAAAGHAVSDLDRAALDTLLADPDEPFRRPGVVLLKDSRSSTVAEFDLPVDGEPRRVIYKRFRVTSWTDPLTALLRRTPALRSWVNGQGLRERCLPTPRPLLVLHRRRRGLAHEGYLITEKVLDAEELAGHAAGLHALPDPERRPQWRALIEQLARLVADLHRRQISQRDLKAANILVQRTALGPALWLIDLVGVTVHRQLSRGRRVQNLTRLHASFHADPGLTRTDRLRFLRTYLAWGLHGQEGWKDWWRQIARATAQKLARNERNGRVLC